MVSVLAAKERDERDKLYDYSPVMADDRRTAVRRQMFFVSAIVMASAVTPASAQVRVNMNEISCREWLRYDPGVRNAVRFWMSGYYGAAANNAVMDYDRLQMATTKIVAYCRRHGSSNLPTAIQNTQ